jgi:hypothetical protein
MYSRFTPRGKSAGRFLAKAIGAISGVSLCVAAIAGVVQAVGRPNGGHGGASNTKTGLPIGSPGVSSVLFPQSAVAVPASAAKKAEPQDSYAPALEPPTGSAPPTLREPRIHPIEMPLEKPFVYIFRPSRPEEHVRQKESRREEVFRYTRTHQTPTTTHTTTASQHSPPPSHSADPHHPSAPPTHTAEPKRQPPVTKPPAGDSHQSERRGGGHDSHR